MANRLKAYVRRTILEAAREYSYPAKRRTAEGTRNAFMDAMRGTDTGWWRDLIYTAPMLDMAFRYRTDIASAFIEYMEETGERLPVRHDEGFLEHHAIAACAYPASLADHIGDDGLEGQLCDARLWGLRFAVEWYAGEMAREYCPDL